MVVLGGAELVLEDVLEDVVEVFLEDVVVVFLEDVVDVLEEEGAWTFFAPARTVLVVCAVVLGCELEATLRSVPEDCFSAKT